MLCDGVGDGVGGDGIVGVKHDVGTVKDLRTVRRELAGANRVEHVAFTHTILVVGRKEAGVGVGGDVRLAVCSNG